MAKKKTGKILASAVSGKPPKEIDQSRDLNTDWILYYKESLNSFPNDLSDKNLKSGTNSGIINSKHTLTVGNGLKYLQDGEDVELAGNDLDYVDEVNNQGLALEEMYSSIAFNYILIGAAYVEGVRKDGQVFYFPHDSTRVRLGKRNSKGVIEKAYISPDWQQIKNSKNLTREQKSRLVTIDMYNGTETQKRFLIKITRDYPGLDYYGVPDYIAAVLSGWVDINYRIGKYNIDDLDNGCFPSVLLQLFGEPPEGMKPKQYIESIVRDFTGEGNNGKILAQLLDDPAQAANLIALDKVGQGHFQTLDDMSDQQLITAHGWYRSLTGLAESGSLGNTEQIRNEFDLAMNMKVIPAYRRPLNRFFNKLLKIAGKDFQVGVINMQPLTLSNTINVNKCLTVNEGRAALGYSELEDEVTGTQLIDLQYREDDDTASSGNGDTE